MEADWIGRAVSIECDESLGVFQGIIKEISEEKITIIRAFRNGVPVRHQHAEVAFRSSDIVRLKLIPAVNGEYSSVTPTVINKPTPVKLPNFLNIIGAKQQLEHQQRMQQKQKQKQNQEQEQQLTPSSQLSDIAQQQQQQQRPRRNGPNGNSTGTNGYGTKSTLSAQMQNMKLNTNGVKSTPNNSRAPSAQQLQQATPPGSSSSTNTNNASSFFGNMIPPKVEGKLGGTCNGGGRASSVNSNAASDTIGNNGHVMQQNNTNDSGGSSRPIDIVTNQQQQITNYMNGNGNGNSSSNGRRNGNGNGNGNGYGNGHNSINSNGNNNKKQQRNKVRRENSMKQQQQTFGTSVDDPLLHEDFDFEGNLALFDKRAIWNDIESTEQNPEMMRQTMRAHENQKKYRHDENVLESEPMQLRQIQTLFAEGSKDFVTDEGLIIPTIPQFVRTNIELTAKQAGLSVQRQLDILARGASDLAISLLGGARRLTPNNYHQWPKIAIICDDSEQNLKMVNIAAATGRQLAGHGLTVLLYIDDVVNIEQSVEISLFKATGNTIVHTTDALPNLDLVILSSNNAVLSEHITKWLSKNRASILAIDPPPCGLRNIAVKYSILPMLPLNGISSNNCGKLYLCNLGIPDKFYRDCGIKYKSPYGHKYVIPIHTTKD